MRREIVVLLCFIIFASCQDVILDNHCELYYSKNYCLTITQINCTSIVGEFKLEGKLISNQTFDISSIIGGGGMTLYTYPASIGGVTGRWSIGNVTVNQASFWFTEIRRGVSAARKPTQVPRTCDVYCPDDCNGRGTCTNGFCQCREEYIGYACNILADVEDHCFADVNNPGNTLCVSGPGRIEDCHFLTFDVRVGNVDQEWVVNIRNPLTESNSNQWTIENNGCTIDLDIFALAVEDDGTVRGVVTATMSCVGTSAYPINSFTKKIPTECEEICSYSTLDARVFPEPTDIFLNKDAEVYYTMQQFADNPIIDLSFNVQVAQGTLEASYNPLCRPTEENSRDTQTFSSTAEWVIIPRDECSARIFDPQHAMFYYFRYRCLSDNGCQFSLDVIYHNVDELQVKSENSVSPRYMPIFNIPFYQYYQVVIPKETFQLKLEINYNDQSNVLAEIYVLSSSCASKKDYALATTQRASTNHTEEGRIVDEYLLDVYLDSTLNINAGQYLEITVNFTTVNGEFPIGYYSLVAVYPTDIPSLPPVVDPETPTPPIDPVTPIPPESTGEETSGESTDSDSNGDGDSDSNDGDDDDDGDDESSNNTGLYVGLSIGALLLVALVLVIGLGVGFVLYRRSKKSRYPLSIDDDGLLLSDEGGVDFDL